MRRFTLFLFASTVAAVQSFAQQDPRFTNYFYNQQYFNPAYAGLDGTMRFVALGRTQWAGYSQNGSAPNTILLSGSAPILRANSGVGIVAYGERFAALTTTAVRGNYAYHLKVGSGKLSFGGSAGIIAQGRDRDRYVVNDKDDPSIPATTTDIKFDVGAGVYYRSEKFFAGFSGMHLNAPSFSFNGGNSTNSAQTLERHYYGILGYNFELSPTLTLTPSALYKSAAFNSKATSIEGNVTANFNNTFSVGVGYTQQEAVNFLANVALLKDKSLRLGYALDLVTNGVDAKQSTSHEIMLAYVLPVALKAPKPAIRTPRYRK